MKQKCIRALAALLCLGSLLQSAGAVNATPTTNPIYVNGVQVELDSYTIDGFTYYKIRDLAEVLNIETDYDTSTDSVLIWDSDPKTKNDSPTGDDPSGTQKEPDKTDDSTPPAFGPDQPIPTNPDTNTSTNTTVTGDPPGTADAKNPGSSRGVVDGKIVVLLDAGHSGSDGGAHDAAAKHFERDYNIIIAQMVQKTLEANGAEVHLVREPQETQRIPETERQARIRKYAREYPIDVLVSIHHNGANQKATGSEVLVQIAYEKGGPGQDLAHCIESEYRALGRTIRPTKYQHSEENDEKDRQYLLRVAYEEDLLAVISEYCFMDVPSDLQLILTTEGQQKEADALSAAILKYFASHPF